MDGEKFGAFNICYDSDSQLSKRAKSVKTMLKSSLGRSIIPDMDVLGSEEKGVTDLNADCVNSNNVG